MNLSWGMVGLAWACTAVIATGVWLHHEGAKSEAIKIQTQTAAVVKQVEKQDAKIRSLPNTDGIVIMRLQRGTYFPQ